MKKDDYLKHKMTCPFSVPLQWFLDQQRRERERKCSPLSAYMKSVAKKHFILLPGFSGTFFFTKETVAVFSVPFYSLLPSKGK